jgi:SAM-dependent methyltransferase
VLACRDHLVTGEPFDVVECGGCGLRMTAPQPDAQAIGRYYESEAYLPMTNTGRGAVATTYRAVRRLTVRLRLRLVTRHAPRSRGRLLDVGCGTGEFLAHARDRGWNVVGVEPSPRAAADAERHGLAVRRVASLAEVADGRFDAITLWHALEHMHDPGCQLAEVRRLLTPGGCVVVAVPNRQRRRRRVRRGMVRVGRARHLWHFRRDARPPSRARRPRSPPSALPFVLYRPPEQQRVAVNLRARRDGDAHASRWRRPRVGVGILGRLMSDDAGAAAPASAWRARRARDRGCWTWTAASVPRRGREPAS